MSDVVSLSITDPCKTVANKNVNYGLSRYSYPIKIKDYRTKIETTESFDLIISLFIMKKSAQIHLRFDLFSQLRVIEFIDRCRLIPISITILTKEDSTELVFTYDEEVYIILNIKNKYNIADLILELNPGISNHPDNEIKILINGWLKYRTSDLIVEESNQELGMQSV